MEGNNTFSSFWFISLCVALILLLYCRSWPIDRWMSTLFPGKETLGEFVTNQVDHVFCATDLEFGQPFFFSTADRGRMFSNVYGRADAPNVMIKDAVRASAAFPPAIPPLLLRPGTLWVYEQGLKLKSSTLPERIWLTDGGAFNNFGSEWHQLRNELSTLQTAFLSQMRRDDEVQDGVSRQRERYGQVQLIVDASLIPAAKRMWPFRIPVIGFLAYFLRTMAVVY